MLRDFDRTPGILWTMLASGCVERIGKLARVAPVEVFAADEIAVVHVMEQTVQTRRWSFGTQDIDSQRTLDCANIKFDQPTPVIPQRDLVTADRSIEDIAQYRPLSLDVVVLIQ